MKPQVDAGHDSESGAGRDRVRALLLGGSLGLLVLVGLVAENAAKPGLGARGWAPGELPWTLSSAWTTALLAAAYLLGAGAVARGILRRPSRPWPWAAVLGLGVVMLLTEPFGSADHTNYVAYGQIALHGGDPYAVSPAEWHGGTDPIAGLVQPPWSHVPSVYGPVATALAAAAAWGGQDNLRQAVWCWQVIIVLAWLVVRWLARRLTTDHVRVDVLWTTNPLVIGVAVLGAHVDVVATALAVAALVLATRGRWSGPVLAGVAAGAASSTKVTYGVVAAAVVIGWLAVRAPGRRASRALARSLLLVATSVAVALPLHLAAGAHVLEQLSRSRKAISFATPWRLLFQHTRDAGPDGLVRQLIVGAAVVVCIALAALLWRLTAGVFRETPSGQAARATVVLTLAYVLGAPYVLPWYDGLAWAALAAVAVVALSGVATVDAVLLAWATVSALAYVPGRVVGMTPTVEDVTLGFRRDIAPWLVLVVWVGVVVASVRRTSVLPSPRGSRSDA